MTKNSNHKAAVRAYAEKHGLSYTEANRRLTTEALNLLDQISAGAESLPPRRVVQIQQPQRPDGVLPYPFFITDGGFVLRQDFWHGDPLHLIGFEDPTLNERNIAVSDEEFWEDPDLAVGLAPVFSDFVNRWATHGAPVDSVAVSEWERPHPKHPVWATVRGENGTEIDIEVSEFLDGFSTKALTAAVEDRWAPSDDLNGLLFMAAKWGKDPAAEGFLLRFNDEEDDEEEDRGFSVILNPEMADAWLAASRRVPRRSTT